MAKFVKVAGADGSPGYLNPDQVVAVLPGTAKGVGPVILGACTVVLPGGLMVPVKEAPAELADRLEGGPVVAK